MTACPGEDGISGLINGMPKFKPRSINKIPIIDINTGTICRREFRTVGLIKCPAKPTSIIAGNVPAPNSAIKLTLSIICVNESVAAIAMYTIPHGSRPFANPKRKKLNDPTAFFKSEAISFCTPA